MMREIKFEVVKGLRDREVTMPYRSTTGSAGYDFVALEDVTLPSIWDTETRPILVKTGVKAKFPNDVVLKLFSRSSLGVKKGLMLPNSVGIIDSDYYSNPSNDGEIMFPFINMTSTTQKIRKGQRIGQGVFSHILLTSDDNAVGDRKGGIGSTGE